MKPLIVLIAAFILSLSATYLFKGHAGYVLSGNIAFCVMLCFTAIAHFAFRKGMAMMIPDFIPFKPAWVLITGIFEIAAGVGLLFSEYRKAVAYALIVFFVLILPANINAAVKKIYYEKGTFDGKGLSYLRFRIPLQILFIAWVWYFGIKN